VGLALAHKAPYNFTLDGVEKIEKLYNAKYMGYWCTQRKDGNWDEVPTDVFYVENPDITKGHTNYFGLTIQNGTVLICNAESCFNEDIVGLVENNEVYVSRYRHDQVITPLGMMIDGGRDYCHTSKVGVPNSEIELAEMKLSNVNRFVKVTVNKDKFEFSEIVDNEEQDK